ncbi:hypothetical protein U1839_12045 [Sphingomonas sp. RT2P30]|uniref:hypothetical protein n=1 Tax=Parasphingomonas halimpatiens TaxID=3096162 RepID=UPI002FC90330
MIFKINGGDGDQHFFSSPFLVEECCESWFDENTPRGTGILVKIISGSNLGTFLVLTSKVTSSIENQIAHGGWASVVVHTVREIGDKFESNLDNLRGIGMAAIQKIS